MAIGTRLFCTVFVTYLNAYGYANPSIFVEYSTKEIQAHASWTFWMALLHVTSS